MSSFISHDHMYLILLVCFNIFSTFALFSQPYISLNLAFLAFSSVRQIINNTVLGCRALSLQCGRESLISIFFKTLRVKPFRKLIGHMSNTLLFHTVALSDTLQVLLSHNSIPYPLLWSAHRLSLSHIHRSLLLQQHSLPSVPPRVLIRYDNSGKILVVSLIVAFHSCAQTVIFMRLVSLVGFRSQRS
jgi:hypothetical protein